MIAWKVVPPTGEERDGTMNGATISNGYERGQFADVHAPDIKMPALGRDFRGVWSDDAHHFVGGRLYVKVTTQAPPGHVLAAEVLVYGLVCGIRDVLMVGTASSATGPLLTSLEGYKASYVTLGVEARKIVDGLPSDAPVPVLSFSIAGRLFR